MPYIIGASLVAIGLLSWQLSSANSRYDVLLVDSAQKIERAQANVKTMETALEEQRAAVSKLMQEMTEQRVRSEFREVQLAELRNTLNEERQKNESYKNRWTKVSNAKPILISRLINRATRKRVREIQATTCRANCNADENSSNGS